MKDQLVRNGKCTPFMRERMQWSQVRDGFEYYHGIQCIPTKMLEAGNCKIRDIKEFSVVGFAITEKAVAPMRKVSAAQLRASIPAGYSLIQYTTLDFLLRRS